MSGWDNKSKTGILLYAEGFVERKKERKKEKYFKMDSLGNIKIHSWNISNKSLRLT